MTDNVMKRWYAAAVALRLGLLAYGEWQDQALAVKFTDVDYSVFTDAAKFVTEGQSPYSRSTFRYTPLLAWALTPNIYLHRIFGKLVFILFDILTGCLIFNIIKHQNFSENIAKMSSLLWLLNPIPAVVSSRGNAESLMAYLVLQMISLLQKKQLVLAAVVYGLAIHVKIYPATYAPLLYLYLCSSDKLLKCKPLEGSTLKKEPRTEGVYDFLRSLTPTWTRIKFCAVAGITALSLTAWFYYQYGWEFLYETYLYHIVRKDIRHNFSPFFYLLYLTSENETSLILKFLVFFPQLLLLIAIAVRFKEDLPMGCFLCTFTFVMLNKVCTSQYFLWYLCLLPLLVPKLNISGMKTAFVAAVWFLGQGLWLFPAYYLEFKGHSTFFYIWLAGLLFFLANVYVSYFIISNYSHMPERNLISKRQ